MKYNVISVADMDGVVVFKLLCKHPVFGTQSLIVDWEGEPGLTVDDWLALPEQQQTARLSGILRPEIVKHWDSLRRAAGELPPLEPEFPHLIGQEIV
jgi:hypothetical protein